MLEDEREQQRYVFQLEGATCADPEAPCEAQFKVSSQLFFLNYIVAKDESYFSHGSGLVLVCTLIAEDVTRRVAGGMNPRKVSAQEEASVLKGRGQSEASARAARTEHQIEGLLCGAPRSRNIFPTPWE
jgi:hypothetical protein